MKSKAAPVIITVAVLFLFLTSSALSLPGLLGKTEKVTSFDLETSAVYGKIKNTYEEYYQYIDDLIAEREAELREAYKYTVTETYEELDKKGKIVVKEREVTKYPSVVTSKYLTSPKFSLVFSYITVKHCELQNMKENGIDQWNYDDKEIFDFLWGITNYTESVDVPSKETVYLTVNTTIKSADEVASQIFVTQQKRQMYIFAYKTFEQSDSELADPFYSDIGDATGSMGWVSRLYETGSSSNHPERISSGAGDAGGKSYGTIQLAINTGSVHSFVQWLAGYDSILYEALDGYVVGSEMFDSAWKSLAANRPDDFAAAQNCYGYTKYAIPWIKEVLERTGIDMGRSYALQEMAYSRAVQMGTKGGLDVFAKAGLTDLSTDEQIISGYYDYLHDHVHLYWSKCSRQVQVNVATRMINEKNTLLGIVGKERPDLSTGASAENTDGQKVVDYALQFVGNPYVWGGTSLTQGADCSGFVMSVYKHFGIDLPHSSYSLRSCGTEVTYGQALPGDLICYDGHVAIYMGGGKIVGAQSKALGITTANATYREIISVRRIVNQNM